MAKITRRWLSDELQASLTGMQSDIIGLSGAVDNLGVGLSGAMLNIAGLTGAINALETGQNYLFDIVEDHATSIWGLSGSVSTLQVQVAGLTGAVNDLQNYVFNLDANAIDLQPVTGMVSDNVQDAIEELKLDIEYIGLSGIGLSGLGGTGVQGPTGPYGPIGLRGPTGFQGSTGPVGTQGLTGVEGTTGNRGITGPSGITGIQGLTGIVGLAGPTGVVLNQGVMDYRTVNGITGTYASLSYVYITGLSNTFTLSRSASVFSALTFKVEREPLTTDHFTYVQLRYTGLGLTGILYSEEATAYLDNSDKTKQTRTIHYVTHTLPAGTYRVDAYGKSEAARRSNILDSNLSSIILDGPVGPIGETGLQGPPGSATGYQGVTGFRGITGPGGITGVQGPTGISAIFDAFEDRLPLENWRAQNASFTRIDNTIPVIKMTDIVDDFIEIIIAKPYEWSRTSDLILKVGTVSEFNLTGTIQLTCKYQGFNNNTNLPSFISPTYSSDSTSYTGSILANDFKELSVNIIANNVKDYDYIYIRIQLKSGSVTPYCITNTTLRYVCGIGSGPTGSQGPTGLGVTGLIGQTGIQGPTGAQGPTGLGVTGLIGQTGVQGPTGFRGVTGLGATGSIGYTGSIGPTGAIGVTGAYGGPPGATGAAGPTGFQGVTGLIGQTGVQGVTGLGITGLIGHTGAIGVTGAYGGPQGTTGAAGVTGLGVTGLIGQTGAQGFTGIGATGLIGQTGAHGITGLRGTTGTQGLTGAQGLTGTGVSFVRYLEYQYDASNTKVSISNGKLTLNGSNPSTATEMYFTSTHDYSGGTTIPDSTNINIFYSEKILYNMLRLVDYDNQSYYNLYRVTSKTKTFEGAGGTEIIIFGLQHIALSTDYQTSQTNYASGTNRVYIVWEGFPGPTGVQGVTGIIGNTGLGVTGPGITGLPGPTGFMGVTGWAGATGPQGLGLTGLIGATGIQGTTGIQGQTGLGATGLQGPTGWQGDTGSVGPAGATGLQFLTVARRYFGGVGVGPTSGQLQLDNSDPSLTTQITINTSDGAYGGHPGLNFFYTLNSGMTLKLVDIPVSPPWPAVDQSTFNIYRVTNKSSTVNYYILTVEHVTKISGYQTTITNYGSGSNEVALIIYGEPGDIGSTGVIGPTGWQGETGIQGQTGLGVTGLIGNTGLIGPTGWQGETGIQGQTGLGVTGLIGNTGIQGATGIQGTTGAQGQTGLGVTGLIGNTGIQGATGIQGQTGLGATGLIGPTGIQGATGARGTTGLANFTRGSAFPNPVDLQFHYDTDDEIVYFFDVGASAWIDITSGTKAETGPIGVTGLIGPTGFQGVTGFQGQTGAQGSTGLGVTGLIGQTGVQGPTGAQGATGFRGVTGIDANVTGVLNLIMSGGGNQVPTGVIGDILLPYRLRFTNWYLMGTPTGYANLILNIGNYTSYPPSTAMHDSASGPWIVKGIKNTATIGTPIWTCATGSAGDVVRVTLNTVTGMTNLLLALNYYKY